MADIIELAEGVAEEIGDGAEVMFVPEFDLKGMVKMHFADGAHHTPPCATAAGLQKTLHAAMGAAIISLLSAVATLVFEVVRAAAR